MTIAEAKKYDHITTNIIEADIKDTQDEIDAFNGDLIVFNKYPMDHRLDIMKREVGIKKREAFNSKLNQILEHRKTQ